MPEEWVWDPVRRAYYYYDIHSNLYRYQDGSSISLSGQVLVEQTAGTSRKQETQTTDLENFEVLVERTPFSQFDKESRFFDGEDKFAGDRSCSEDDEDVNEDDEHGSQDGRNGLNDKIKQSSMWIRMSKESRSKAMVEKIAMFSRRSLESMRRDRRAWLAASEEILVPKTRVQERVTLLRRRRSDRLLEEDRDRVISEAIKRRNKLSTVSPTTPTSNSAINLRNTTLTPREETGDDTSQGYQTDGDEISSDDSENFKVESDIDFTNGADLTGFDDCIVDPTKWQSEVDNVERTVVQNSRIGDFIRQTLSDFTWTLAYCKLILQNAIESLTILQSKGYAAGGFSALVLCADRDYVAELKYVTSSQISNLLQDIEASSLTPLMDFLRYVGMNRNVEKIERLPLGNQLQTTAKLIAIFVDVGVVSYAAAHIEKFDQKYFYESVDDLALSGELSLCRRSLNCLQDFMRGEKVWVFEEWSGPTRRRLEPLLLVTTPDILADTWGPVWIDSAGIEQFGYPQPLIESSETTDSVADRQFSWDLEQSSASIDDIDLRSRKNDVSVESKANSNPGSPKFPLRFRRYIMGSGSIIPVEKIFNSISKSINIKPDEVLAHWTSDKDEIMGCHRCFQQTPKITLKLLIGAGSRMHKNKSCNIDPKNYTNTGLSKNFLTIFGTKQSSLNIETEFVALGTPPGLQIGANLKPKIRHGSTLRDRLNYWIQNPQERNPALVRQQLAVEVSACTHNAKRVRLGQVLCSSAMRHYFKSIHYEWSSDVCADKYFSTLLEDDFESFQTLYKNNRESIGNAIALSLKLLVNTGTENHQDFNSLWIPDETAVYMAKFSARDQKWAGLLSDTMHSCALGIVILDCLEFQSGRWPSVCRSLSDRQAYLKPQSVLKTNLVINRLANTTNGLRIPKGAERWQLHDVRNNEELDLGESGRLCFLSTSRGNDRAIMIWKSPRRTRAAEELIRQFILKVPKLPHHWEVVRYLDHSEHPLPIYVISDGTKCSPPYRWKTRDIETKSNCSLRNIDQQAGHSKRKEKERVVEARIHKGSAHSKGESLEDLDVQPLQNQFIERTNKVQGNPVDKAAESDSIYNIRQE